jgi:hypothetical protein
MVSIAQIRRILYKLIKSAMMQPQRSTASPQHKKVAHGSLIHNCFLSDKQKLLLNMQSVMRGFFWPDWRFHLPKQQGIDKPLNQRLRVGIMTISYGAAAHNN